MIPNKLYIPTTTLNFNNLMSSESISPASFYAIRGFGYKRFETVEPNPLKNRILLYPKCIDFDTKNTDCDDYPLIIEVNTESIEDGVIEEKNGCFYSDQTIYLSPFSTRFIFRNNNELTIALSKAEPSLESKLVGLYTPCFVVRPADVEYLTWNGPVKLKDAIGNNTRSISKDRLINKAKGLMYAYLLAANKSMSSELVLLRRSLKQLRNVLSAVLSGPYGYPTQEQQKQLQEIYNCFNTIFCRNYNERLLAILKEEERSYGCSGVEKFLIKENLWQIWSQNTAGTYNIPVPNMVEPYPFGQIMSKDIPGTVDEYLSDVESKISEEEKSNPKTNLQPSALPIIQNYKIIGTFDQQKEFVVTLLNEFLQEAYTKDDFLQSRYEFAKAGGLLFRDELKRDKMDRWTGSECQIYINSLLKNLNEYTSFDLSSVDNVTLQSFAAFCQKGDADIDKLESYLIDNGISDFRLAFAFWGAIFGYAEMPKTQTSAIYDFPDKKYLETIYKYIFKQLHGVDLIGEMKPIPVPLSPKPKGGEMSFGDVVKRGVKKFIDVLSPNEDRQNKETMNDENIVRPSAGIPCELNALFESEKFKSLNTEAQKYARKEVVELYKVNGNVVNDSFISNLEKISFPKQGRKSLCTASDWKKCLGVLKTGKKKSKNTNDEVDMFMRKTFIGELNVTQTISSGRILQRLINNWDYVQRNQPNEEEQIQHFINLCKKEGRGEISYKYLKGYFTSEVAEQFEKELRQRLLK